MKKGRMMTATVFAEEMSVSYPTVVRWLKRKLVPGAERKESPERGVWREIPEAALQMDRPPAGRKPTTAAASPATERRDTADKDKGDPVRASMLSLRDGLSALLDRYEAQSGSK